MLPSAESIQIILPIISILFLVLTFKKSIYGTISYFIILNAKLGDMYPALGAIRFEFVAAVVVVASIFVKGKGWSHILPQNSTINKNFWILLAVGMLSVPLAVDPRVSWDNGGYTLFKLALFYFMIVASLNNKSDAKKLIWAFVLVTFWIAYEPVINYTRGVASVHGYGAVAIGSFGAATGHVALANTLNQGIPMTVLLALSMGKKKNKIILFLIAFFIVVGVIFTKSRGGFLGLLAIAVGFIYFSKQKVKMMAVMGIFLGLILLISGDIYLSHISTITHGIHGSRSSSDRYLGLLNGISMMIKRPILGVGIGCYAEARSRYFGYYFYSHNLYGELFGELGLASIVWFLWVYAIFKKAKTLKQSLVESGLENKFYWNMLTGIQVSLFVRLFLGNFTHGSFIWFWFFMAALCVSIENIMSRESFPESENPNCIHSSFQ